MDVYRIYSTILMYDHRVNVILCPVKRGHTARDKCSSMFFFSSNGNFGLYFHSSIEIYIFDAEKIKPFPNEPWFLHVYRTSVLKTLRKEEIARYEQFLLFL